MWPRSCSVRRHLRARHSSGMASTPTAHAFTCSSPVNDSSSSCNASPTLRQGGIRVRDIFKGHEGDLLKPAPSLCGQRRPAAQGNMNLLHSLNRKCAGERISNLSLPMGIKAQNPSRATGEGVGEVLTWVSANVWTAAGCRCSICARSGLGGISSSSKESTRSMLREFAQVDTSAAPRAPRTVVRRVLGTPG